MMSLSFSHSELLAYFHGIPADLKKEIEEGKRKQMCLINPKSSNHLK